VLGVGALIFDEDQRLLLVERGREPLKGFWSLPGGVLETGETLAEGVRREVLEETGLLVELVETVEIFERIMRDAQGKTEYHYVLVDYICRVTGGALAAADDVSDVRWVSKQDLHGVRLTEGTLGVIEKAYSILLCSAPAPIYSNTKI
jgi:8-oxo-dGTP diphosphatase